jgi:hypothetical protein
VLPPAPAGPNGQDERAGTGPFAVRAVSVEMLPPPPSVARTLRLSAGASATLVTARFDDTTTGTPAALTVVVLHPDLFRIALEWSDGSKDAHGPWACYLTSADCRS